MTDKSKKQPKEQSKGRLRIVGVVLRGIAVLLVLAVVVGLAAVSTMLNGRYRDRFHRWLTYGSSLEENVYRYSADSGHTFGQMEEYLAVVSQNSFQLLRSDGTAQQDISVRLEQPALTTGGGLAAVWDAAGTTLTVANMDGILLERDEGERLISVRLNQSGWLTVTEEKSGYKGAVTVYNQNQEKVFAFHSSSNFLIDAVVSGNGRYLLAATIGQEAGGFVTQFSLYDLTKTEPVSQGELREGLVLDLVDASAGYAAIADEMLVFLDDRAKVTATYGYDEAYLRDYSLNGDDFAALLLGRYRAGTVGRLVTVDRNGKEVGSLELTREVLDISTAGGFVSVLYSDELIIYHRDLTRYASSRETELAGEVIMSEDGSALVISADSAWRFLP